MDLDRNPFASSCWNGALSCWIRSTGFVDPVPYAYAYLYVRVGCGEGGDEGGKGVCGTEDLVSMGSPGLPPRYLKAAIGGKNRVRFRSKPSSLLDRMGTNTQGGSFPSTHPPPTSTKMEAKMNTTRGCTRIPKVAARTPNTCHARRPKKSSRREGKGTKILHAGVRTIPDRKRTAKPDATVRAAAQGTAAVPELPKESVLDTARALLFYLTTTLLAIPLFVSMLVMHPFVMALDKYKRGAQHFVNNVWANLTTSLFFRIQVIGRENLPPKGQPVVYVANHQSYLDIYTLFALWRPFKFISKTSNFLIPIVGWSMYLTGHIGLKRMDRRSQLDCLKTCGEMLQRGASVLFFPEGTRSDTGEMGDFKKGAFSVAKKAKVSVVPITLVGTGALMPNGKEGVLRPGKVKMIVHPSIQPDKDADEMCKEAQEVIASSLRH